MKKLILLAALTCVAWAPPQKDVSAWERQAQNVTIVRDDWGIAHIHGKTDADAVFGMIYAQAEDDFNRVETNYLNSMGRLAEAEGLPRLHAEGLDDADAGNGFVQDVLDFGELVLALARGGAYAEFYSVQRLSTT